MVFMNKGQDKSGLLECLVRWLLWSSMKTIHKQLKKFADRNGNAAMTVTVHLLFFSN
jgi:hypothetical protein